MCPLLVIILQLPKRGVTTVPRGIMSFPMSGFCTHRLPDPQTWRAMRPEWVAGYMRICWYICRSPLPVHSKVVSQVGV